MLVLQLFQVQLVDLPEHQQLPVQELHLLLNRLAIGELSTKQTPNWCVDVRQGAGSGHASSALGRNPHLQGSKFPNTMAGVEGGLQKHGSGQ